MNMGSTIKVLFIHHSGLAAGGAERSLFELVTALKTLGIHVSVMLPADGQLGARLTEAGIAVSHAPMRALSRSKNPFKQMRFLYSLLRTARIIRRMVRYYQIDIVHANSTSAAIYASRALGKNRGKSVINNQGSSRKKPEYPISSTERRLTNLEDNGQRTTDNGPVLAWHCRDMVELGWVGRWLGSRVSMAVAISDRVGQHLESYLSPERIHIIKNGVDPTCLEQGRDGDELRRDLGIPQASHVVGMAAHLVPWKNHDLFLGVCARIAEVFPEAHFVIAGSELNGPVAGYKHRLIALAEELGISTQIHFLGNLSDMGGFYRAIDVLCHPAKNEPFGRVVAEAMMQAVPVVVGEGAGPAEFVQDDETGLVAGSYSAEAFCGAIKRLLDDPREGERIGKAGAAYARKNLSVNGTAEQICRLYEDLPAFSARA